jgi:putative colanic acid biosynthesis UDP-glucose lipid carrier transferase
VAFKVTESYSRVWLFSTIILSFLSLVILKVIFDLFYHYLITSNIIQRNILLVGDSSSCKNIIKKFPKRISNSVIKCLIIIDSEQNGNTHYYGVPRVNLKDDLNYVLSHHAIGQTWIVSSIKTQVHIEQLIDKFMNYSVDCRLISPESKFKFVEGLDSEAGFNFYNVSFSPFYGTNFLIKNVMDRLLSLFFLILSIPIIIIASIFIFLQDGFPIFFKQKRTGWDGRSFYIHKLRTLSKLSDSAKTKQVESGDRRVLGIGLILRRFSIDELPQLYNVLKGEMSIVGPRPHMIEHTQFYSEEILNFMQRHKCLPGLTGWAQIHGFRGPTRSKELMDKRFQHDLYYIKNWNLMLDFYIIIRTFFVILFQKVD